MSEAIGAAKLAVAPSTRTFISMSFMIKFRKFFPTRPEGVEALSPGQWTQAARPEGAEALSPGQWTQAARPEGGRSS